jgi:hypothetical protein
VDRVVSIEDAEQILFDIRQRNAAMAQSSMAKDDAQTQERQAGAALKQTQAEALAAKTPVQNAESIARIQQGQEQTSLQRSKQEQEAVGKLLDVVQREQAVGR